MERMTRLLAGLLGTSALLLPPARRQWAEAIQAEAGQFPAGWRRLHWLAGGLWLVAREAGMARKIVYWIGIGVVVAAAAWAIGLSWRTVPAADPESVTDRFRVLTGAFALLVLPWLGRRRSGLFGPVGGGITPRLVRVAGCAAICGLGVQLVRLDRNAGSGSGLGNGHFSWPQQIIGLALLAAAAALPPVIRAVWPQVNAAVVGISVAVPVVIAFAVVPMQVLVIAYVAGILAATSRRSPVSGAALAIGTITGLAAGLVIYRVVAAQLGLGLIGFLFVSVILFLVAGGMVGLAAAWLVPGPADPQEQGRRRIRQGLLAGATMGAVGGLLVTVIFVGIGFLLVTGPLFGAVGGVLGGAVVAAYRRKPLAGGFQPA
jgi:hypothetical protein